MEATARPRPSKLHMPARLLRAVPNERLVALVRAGSEPAFEAIYERHHRGILAFCRHMLGSAHEAEDAVQHTFLAAYRDLLASEKPIVLRPWLYAIARNRSLSTLRARRERPASDEADLEVATEGLAAQVERRQDLRELLADIGRLPDEQRGALVLAELGDLSHEEVADVMGVRKEKVKALVFQARESLAVGRQARETPCAEVREELSTARGAALRRAPLRRHLGECAGCRAFRDEIKQQRRAMAAILPVIPTAGLKAGSLPWIAGAGGAGAAGGGLAGGAAGVGGATAAGAASTGVGGLVAGVTIAKVLAVAAVVAGTGGGLAVVHQLRSSGDRSTTQRTAAARPSVAAGAPAAIPVLGVAVAASPVPGSATGTPAQSSGPSARGKRPKGERGRSDTAANRTKEKKGRDERVSNGAGNQGRGNDAGGSKGGGAAKGGETKDQSASGGTQGGPNGGGQNGGGATGGGKKGDGDSTGGSGSGSGGPAAPAPAPASEGKGKAN
ncbi:MAG: RNA polymerase sigma factor [Solirubrobacteraceae bacterium]